MAEGSPIRGSLKRPIGASPRSEFDPKLADEVQMMLDEIEKRGEGIRVAQFMKAQESVDAVAGPSPVYRPATRSELNAGALNLARRLQGGEDPSESDLNAALVMMMDSEDQRRRLFEQKTGVRTPDTLTGISSLDDPRALQQLASETGVGEKVPGDTFFGNIRAFFDLP